ncbi:calcium sensor EFh, partial [Azotobacter chroococcum]|nr:calcium sensor EFh [Azotobacter chroococcum]
TSSDLGRIRWPDLKLVIREILVDFVYQGFTKGPNPMRAGMNNNIDELIRYIENTPAIKQYEDGRHRALYLKKHKREIV